MDNDFKDFYCMHLDSQSKSNSNSIKGAIERAYLQFI